jgi:hypothetical protein
MKFVNGEAYTIGAFDTYGIPFGEFHYLCTTYKEALQLLQEVAKEYERYEKRRDDIFDVWEDVPDEDNEDDYAMKELHLMLKIVYIEF